MFLRQRKKSTVSISSATSSSRIYKKLKSKEVDVDRFKRNSGDSSDEEDEYDEHDINRDFKQSRNPKKSKYEGTLNDDWLLCYVASYAAKEFFHSHLVNKKYYKLKKKYLTSDAECPVDQLQRRVKEAIQISLEQAVLLFKRFLVLSHQTELSKKEIDSIADEVMEKFTEKAASLVELKTTIFIKWLKLNSEIGADYEFEEIEEFECELVGLLIEEFMRHLSFDNEGHDREKVKRKALVLAKDTMVDITRDFGFEKKAYNDGKNHAIDLLNQYTGPYQNLMANVKSILHQSQARGLVMRLITNKLMDKKLAESFTKAFVEDLVSIKTRNLPSKKNSKGKKHGLSAKEQEIFDQYFTYSSNSIEDEISQFFHSHLHQELRQKIRKFQRQTLASSHLFSSHNIGKLIANIRLLNRSQTRNRRNLQYSIFKEDVAIRNWRLTRPFLQGTDVCETQRILKNSFGRMDMVLGLGNYEDVYAYINDIKLYFAEIGKPIQDKNIAEWMISILNGNLPELATVSEDKIEILGKLQAITYLIFGCEVARNPAMLIINCMLLDLIRHSDKWTFEEALVGRNTNGRLNSLRRMPMAPEGAVSAARALEEKLQKTMPYRYSYQGICDEAGTETMIKQEATIVREWFALKGVAPSKKIEKNTLPGWLLERIKEEFEVWFDSNADKIIDNDDNENNKIKLRR